MQAQTGEICTGACDSRGWRLKSLVRPLNLHFRSTGYTSPNSTLNLAHSCSFCPHHHLTGFGTPLSSVPAPAQHSQFPASPDWGLWFSHLWGSCAAWPLWLREAEVILMTQKPSTSQTELHILWFKTSTLKLFLKSPVYKNESHRQFKFLRTSCKIVGQIQ